MQKQEFLYKGPNHAANLNDMRLKDKYCDVTIKVDGKEIRAHKVILAANLKYFETMFSSDSFKESQGGDITMESVENADLEAFVSYAYTGEILLTQDNALNLLELANYLSEDGIKVACVEFLEKHLKAEDACRAYKFADTIESLSLKNAAKAKIITNFGDCSKIADYLTFDHESLMGILSDGKAQSSQMQKMLFEGIMRWIVYDAKERKNCMEELLNSINITKLRAGDVTSCLYKNLLHRNDEYGIIRDAIFHYEASKVKLEKQQQVLMVIDKDGSFQFYNFIEKKWFSHLQIPNIALHRHANNSSAVLNDKLYYISNIYGKNCLQVLDPSSKQVTTSHSSSSILEYAKLVACSRFIYICGGIKPNSSRSNQILRYDPQTNSLETLAPMNCVRSSPALIFYQDCLYVLGGHNGSSTVQSVEKYDPDRNEWTALASMCEKRCGHAVAILNGKLYAYGGYSGTSYESSVEVYNSTTNSWQLVVSMNRGRSYFLLVVHEDKLYAIGGIEEKTVEIYDSSNNQWQMDDEMSAGLQVDCCVGGLIPSSCITNT